MDIDGLKQGWINPISNAQELLQLSAWPSVPPYELACRLDNAGDIIQIFLKFGANTIQVNFQARRQQLITITFPTAWKR